MICLDVTQPINHKARQSKDSVPNFNEHTFSELLLGVRDEKEKDPELHGNSQYSSIHTILGTHAQKVLKQKSDPMQWKDQVKASKLCLGSQGELTAVAFKLCLEERLGVCWYDEEGECTACAKAFAKDCQALQPGIVWLHGGWGPLREAKCHWCGNASGAPVTRAPSSQTGRSIIELLWKVLQEFQSLEIDEGNGYPPSLFWEFVLLTSFPRESKPEFMLTFIFFLP